MPVNLVAHRGDCQHYFENTLASVAEALSQGIYAIEIDIQFSQDKVCVLFHDRSAQRYYANTNRFNNQLAIGELTFAELNNEPFSLTNQTTTSSQYISQLHEVVALIQQYPKATLFVEIKRINFQFFRYLWVYQQVTYLLNPIRQQCVLISFSYRFLRLCRKQTQQPFKLGYVLPEWQSYSPKMLKRLTPEFIFCDEEILPDNFQVTQQPVQWVFYDVASLNIAQRLIAQGAYWLETFTPSARRTQLQQLKINCQ